MGEYFTRDIKIPRYNWVITVFEPTLQELVDVQDKYNKQEWPAVASRMFTLIKKWDCTDRNGENLPLTEEGMKKLPITVFTSLFVELGKVLLTDDGPKNS